LPGIFSFGVTQTPFSPLLSGGYPSVMTENRNPVVEYRARLFPYLLHLVGDPHEADDLFQDLSVAVLENPSMLRRAGDVFAYLRGVARHLASGRRRLHARTGESLRRWTEWAWEADPGDDSADDDRRRQVAALHHCREALQETSRKLLALRYDQGLDLKAISDALGSTEGAVKMMFLRVRQALAKCIRARLAGEANA